MIDKKLKSNQALSYLVNHPLKEIKEALLWELEDTTIIFDDDKEMKGINKLINHCKNMIITYQELYRLIDHSRPKILFIIRYHELYLQALENIKITWNNFIDFINTISKESYE